MIDGYVITLSDNPISWHSSDRLIASSEKVENEFTIHKTQAITPDRVTTRFDHNSNYESILSETSLWILKNYPIELHFHPSRSCERHKTLHKSKTVIF